MALGGGILPNSGISLVQCCFLEGVDFAAGLDDAADQGPAGHVNMAVAQTFDLGSQIHIDQGKGAAKAVPTALGSAAINA
jgi:hypothetical protein